MCRRWCARAMTSDTHRGTTKSNAELPSRSVALNPEPKKAQRGPKLFSLLPVLIRSTAVAPSLSAHVALNPHLHRLSRPYVESLPDGISVHVAIIWFIAISLLTRCRLLVPVFVLTPHSIQVHMITNHFGSSRFVHKWMFWHAKGNVAESSVHRTLGSRAARRGPQRTRVWASSLT